MTRRVRHLVAVSLTALLVAAGCGSESEIEVSGEASTTDAAAEPADAAGDGASSDEAAPAEEAPVDATADAEVTDDAGAEPQATAAEAEATEAAEAEPEATEEPSFEGNSGSDWCTLAVAITATSDELDAEDFDIFNPDTLRETYGRFRDQIEGARGAVPGEIAADFDVLVTSFVAFDDALAAVDYDFFAIDAALLDQLDTADLATASNNIELYNEQVCGIPAELEDVPTDDAGAGGDAGDGGSTELPTGTVLDSVVAALVAIGLTEEQATCIVSELGPDALAGDPTSPAYLDAFEICGIDPATLGG
jgi:hypothetical protein